MLDYNNMLVNNHTSLNKTRFFPRPLYFEDGFELAHEINVSSLQPYYITIAKLITVMPRAKA